MEESCRSCIYYDIHKNEGGQYEHTCMLLNVHLDPSRESELCRFSIPISAALENNETLRDRLIEENL